MVEPFSGNQVFVEGNILLNNERKKSKDHHIIWKISAFNFEQRCELNSQPFNLGKWKCLLRLRHPSSVIIPRISYIDRSLWTLYLTVFGPFKSHCLFASCSCNFYFDLGDGLKSFLPLREDRLWKSC